MRVLYSFTMRATECDPEGYYYPRWDRAKKVTVQAGTKQAAINKAADMLGTTPRRGWYWIFKVDRIEEVRSGCTCGGDR